MANIRSKQTEADKPFRKAMRQKIASRFGDLWEAVRKALDGSDPDGVHDVRVASRRLRAAMDVADGCFPNSWFEPLHHAVKEITGSLGEVRDREVMLEFLMKECDSAPASDRAGIDRLIVRIESELERARSEMTAFLESIAERGVPAEAARRFGPHAAAPAGEGTP